VNERLQFLGTEVFGDRYVCEYASASVGLGLLSKRFPETHTTRTFEIPACGSLLATERTVDTVRFFKEDEALFFNDYQELGHRLGELLERPDEIEAAASRGHRRVLSDGRDYASVLSRVLDRLHLPSSDHPKVSAGTWLAMSGKRWNGNASPT
jgi:spore maturation protein CgeB